DEAAQAVALGLSGKKGFFARAIRGFVEESAEDAEGSSPKKKPTTKAGKRAPQGRPWLLERDRYIHQDIFRRTGAVVFSSSRGGEFSYENDALKNGLFTKALLKGLGEKAADTDQDGAVSLAELRIYVAAEVARLSEDRQHPAVDRDNPFLRL